MWKMLKHNTSAVPQTSFLGPILFSCTFFFFLIKHFTIWLLMTHKNVKMSVYTISLTILQILNASCKFRSWCPDKIIFLALNLIFLRRYSKLSLLGSWLAPKNGTDAFCLGLCSLAAIQVQNGIFCYLYLCLCIAWL